jgi:hypothetical protein
VRSRPGQIGFSQRIRLDWLEQTAYLVLAGNRKDAALQEALHDKLSVGGQAERGNREKAITILMKIWISVPAGLEALRNRGLELLKESPRDGHIVVHWGMCTAVYPFWGAVAASVGRLLRLQGTASAAQVQRRVRERFGERETVSRAARRIIRTFVDWGVLAETTQKGVYRPAGVRRVDDPRLLAWLVEAALHAQSNGSATLTALLDAPSMFPFQLSRLHGGDLAAVSGGIQIVRHGLDEELVMLRGKHGTAG